MYIYTNTYTYIIYTYICIYIYVRIYISIQADHDTLTADTALPNLPKILFQSQPFSESTQKIRSKLTF